MRRLASVISIGVIVLLFAAILATGSSPSVAQTAPSDTPATPAAESLGLVVLPEENPTPGATPEVLQLTHVTLEPGASTGQHAHGGSSVLSVIAGAICYTSYSSAGEVKAITTDPTQLNPESCPASVVTTVAPLECTDNSCVIPAGQSIYLPTGSTVTQTEAGGHKYTNVSNETAEVYIVWVRIIDPDSAPCGGGCM
jgi:quercetin dioxygenase-like cupin family protein